MLVFGIYAGFGLIVSPLFLNAGIADQAVYCIVCMIFLVFGIIGCFTVGHWLDKHNKYLLALRVVIVATGAALALSIYLIPTGTIWGSVVFAVTAGLFMVPIVPVGFAFATEVTYPTSPALVIGIMTCTANLILFGLTSVYISILGDPTSSETLPPPGGKENDRIVLFILTAEVGLAFVGSIFVKQDLRRLESGKLQVD